MVRAQWNSLRFSRLEKERLLVALLFSLGLHLAGWSGYEAGKKLDWWGKLDSPTPSYQTIKTNLHASETTEVIMENYEPGTSIESPDQSTIDAPKNAKYESDKNFNAENQNPKNEFDPLNKPHQPHNDPTGHANSPLQPVSKPQSADQQQKNSQLSLAPGDLTLAKPNQMDQKLNNSSPERPRKLSQVSSRPSRSANFQGSLFNIKATTFGKYDVGLIDAVSQRWYDLLDKNNFAYDRQGKIILQFNLHSDGRVTDIKLMEDTVDYNPGGIWAIVCQAAIEDAAPFAPWQSDMAHLIGANYRQVQFEFLY